MMGSRLSKYTCSCHSKALCHGYMLMFLKLISYIAHVVQYVVGGKVSFFKGY